MRHGWLVIIVLTGAAEAAQVVLAADTTTQPQTPSATSGVTVMVYAQGLCNGDEVRLGEIAKVIGPEARVARLKRLPVARSPQPGQQHVLARADIETVLRASPYGRIGVTVVGAENVQLRAGVQVVEGERLANAAIQALEKQFASRPELKAQIELTRVPKALQLRPGEIALRPDLRGQELPNGTASIKVRVLQRMRSVAETTVGVRVKLFQLVPVAARALAEGDVVGDKDVSLELRPVSGSRWEPADASRIVGQAARRAITRGKMLEARMFQTPNVIQRGDRVQLTLVRGALVVTTQAEARSDAAVGETVRLRLLDSGREVLGTTTGKGEAKL